MNDQEVMQCMAVVQEAYDDGPKTVGAPFGGILTAWRTIVKWLKDNGLDASILVANFMEIIAILKGTDEWLVKIQKIFELLSEFLPAGAKANAPAQP